MAIANRVENPANMAAPPVGQIKLFNDATKLGNPMCQMDENGTVTRVGTDNTVEDGVVAPAERQEYDPADYRPESLVDLVNSTPTDLLRKTERELDPRLTGVKHNGRLIEAVPAELAWAQRMNIRTDNLYTFMQDVVRLELERFAERIERHYHLIPKEEHANPKDSSGGVD